MHEIFWLQESQGFTRWHPPLHAPGPWLFGLLVFSASFSRGTCHRQPRRPEHMKINGMLAILSGPVSKVSRIISMVTWHFFFSNRFLLSGAIAATCDMLRLFKSPEIRRTKKFEKAWARSPPYGPFFSRTQSPAMSHFFDETPVKNREKLRPSAALGAQLSCTHMPGRETFSYPRGTL